MRVGLTLSGDNLSEDGAMFAAQLGVTDVVVHFNDYAAGPDAEPYLRGEAVGPILKDCRTAAALWDYEMMASAAAMLARHGLRIAALENLSPAFWSDILLDGPNRAAQMEGLKRLVRDAGRAGICSPRRRRASASNSTRRPVPASPMRPMTCRSSTAPST